VINRYIRPKLLAILAAAFLASWLVQGATIAVLRETQPSSSTQRLVERRIKPRGQPAFTLRITPIQNAVLLIAQGAHNLLGLTTVAVFLGLVFIHEEPKARPATRTIKPLSLDSRDGPAETPGP
jgi:hypothetical protein